MRNRVPGLMDIAVEEKLIMQDDVTAVVLDRKIASRAKRSARFRGAWVLHAMLVPALVCMIIFNYIPMTGILIAFKEYKPVLGFGGSPWVGLDQFRFLFQYDKFIQVLGNTLFFACTKVVLNIIVPFLFALLLNEIRVAWYKQTIQTMTYLPYFLSWVTLAGILLDILSTQGIVNRSLQSVALKPVFFLGDGNWFRFVIISSDVWKEFGFKAIIFLAAITGINLELYEAAEVDGATHFQQVVYITIPSLIPITIVVATLALGGVLNANFDQVFNLYNPLVYAQGDIIDTFVYRVGLLAGRYSLGTAVGLFKSFVSMILIIISYRLAYKLADYRVF